MRDTEMVRFTEASLHARGPFWQVSEVRYERDRTLQRFRDGLVFKAHRLLYHSTLGLKIIKKKKMTEIICFM